MITVKSLPGTESLFWIKETISKPIGTFGFKGPRDAPSTLFETVDPAGIVNPQ
jgi:hypothetical protein